MRRWKHRFAKVDFTPTKPVVNYAIVVGSYRGSPWLQACLDSIPSRFPTIVVRNGGYECGAISWALNNTNLDEFLFLQDSTKLKTSEWVDELFKKVGTSISLNSDPNWGGSFLAKYRREILSKIHIPRTDDKMSAVLAEMSMNQSYAALETNKEILWPELNLASARPDVIHGRAVAVYENEHFVKYKSCSGGDFITPCCERDKAHRAIYD